MPSFFKRLTAKTPRNTVAKSESHFRLFFLLVAMFLAFSATSLKAQAVRDSLSGKTVHVYIQDDNFNTIYFDNFQGTTGLFSFEATYTYKFTVLPASLSDKGQAGFFLRSSGGTNKGDYGYKLGPTGLSEVETKFPVSVFAGHSEIWIILDPTKPLFGTPPIILFEAPKVINILNPWETTAPVLIYGAGTKRAMTTLPNRCGWFTTMLLDPAITKGHFAEVNNADTYGTGGLSSKVDFDFAGQFATKGSSTLWLNTELNAWTTIWPNIDGNCQYLMAATVRDFSKDHTDFEYPSLTGDYLEKGMVQTTIGVDRKPVSTKITPKAPITYTSFDSWWKTDSTNATVSQRSYESCIDIPMSKSSDGLWEYDSYRDSPTDKSFFPIEGKADHFPTEAVASCYVKPPPDTTNWVTNGPKRNGNFCLESHANFIYQPGQKFDFRGDDDVWVFINDKLVVDLGGVHTPKSQSVNLDNLGLKQDSTYKWDFFYCDRQPCGSSLRVKTSIFFKQQRSLFFEKEAVSDGVIFKILKRESGKGSCAGVGADTNAVPATSLVYQLVDVNGKQVGQNLSNGVTYYNGIKINTDKVSITENTITDLAPGKYRVVAFEPANEKTKVELPFTVPSRNFVELDPVNGTAYDTTAIVTALVPVVAANREIGALVHSAEKFTVTFEPTTAKVFSNAAGTTPVTSGSQLATDTSGFYTFWVTGNPAGADNQIVTFQITGSSKKVTVTFKLPPPILVELIPFTKSVPVTEVVPVYAKTYQNGSPLAQATPYTITLSGGKVFADKALTIPVTSGGALTSDATGDDTLWVVGDPAAFADQVVTLQAANSSKQVKITFQLPPLVLPKVLMAGVYDDNSDGIADRITATFDSNLVANLPKQISYTWPADATAVVLPSSALAANLDATGKIFTLKNLALTPKPKTSGEGTFISTYNARGNDIPQSVPLVDHIAPLLIKAEARQGVNGDTLFLTFSEPIGIASITAALGDLFQYKLTSDGAPQALPPTGIGWTEGNTVAILRFAAGITSPQPGQQVRIAEGPGKVADALGNGVNSDSRYRIITGVKRTALTSLAFREGRSSKPVGSEPAITVIRTSPLIDVKTIADSTKRLGFLIKLDLGDYAVKDDFITITPDQVHLKWDLAIFDNTGVFVNRSEGDTKCTDPILFNGDCTLGSSRGNLFISWDLSTKDGGEAGTGAYIARLKFKAYAGTSVVAQNAKDEHWGYLRKR